MIVDNIHPKAYWESIHLLIINDVAGDPFSSTLDETAGAFLIIAYSMQEGSARKATSFMHQE